MTGLMQRHWRIVRTVGGRVLGAALLVALVYVACSLVTSRYALPFVLQTNVRTTGVREVESSQPFALRWFNTTAQLQLPGLSRAPHLLQLRAYGEQPAQVVRITGATPLVATALRPQWRMMQLIVPAEAIADAGPPTLTLHSAEATASAGRDYGFPVSALTLTQLAPGRPTFNLLGDLALLASLLVLLSLVTGLDNRAAVVVNGSALLGLGAALWWRRTETASLLPLVSTTLPWAVALLAGVRLAQWRRWHDDQRWLAGVGVVVAALFVAHAVGMQAPRFIIVDHFARANHVLGIAQGNGAAVQASLSNQYEWSIAVVPYSLYGYYALVPLAWLFSDPLRLATALMVSVSLLDATVPLLLYALVRMTGGDGRTGLYAAMLYAALPVTHLYFHDGSYPTIIGIWVVVVAVVLLVRLFNSIPAVLRPPAATTALIAGQRLRRSAWSTQHTAFSLWFGAAALAVAYAVLVYVTHVAFVPFLLGVMGLTAWWWGRDATRRWGRWVIGATALGVLVALLVYYGAYLPSFVGSIVERLTAGERPGDESTLYLGEDMLGPFWVQAWGHVRWFPLALALGGLWLLRRRRSLLGFVGLGYAVLFTLLAVADVFFLLWHKHWYFALPGLALLAAQPLAWAAERGKVLRLGVWLLLSYLVTQSAWAWGLRVFAYTISLRTM